MQKKNIVILISGSGSNLQSFIDCQKLNRLAGTISAVISNKADAYGLIRAKSANIPAISIKHTDYSSREAFDQALSDQIEQYNPDLIILAGFMRILTSNFVAKYRGKLLNIHPSLLPKYPGLHTHQRAIENKDVEHGTSIHFVTEELDGGPLIAQAKILISDKDNVDSLFKKIQKLEHKIYPQIAQMFLENKIELKQDDIYFENSKLEAPFIL